MSWVDPILEAAGGVGAVAAAFKLPYTTVDSWQRRGSIPFEWLALLQELARKRRQSFSIDKIAEKAASKHRWRLRSAA